MVHPWWNMICMFCMQWFVCKPWWTAFIMIRTFIHWTWPLLNKDLARILMKRVIFVWVPTVTLLQQNQASQEALLDYLSQLLLMAFTLTRNRERQADQETHSSRVEICRWLLRNKMNNVSIDGTEVKVLMQHHQKSGGSIRPPASPLTLTGPNKSTLYTSRRNLKSQITIAKKNLTCNGLGNRLNSQGV